MILAFDTYYFDNKAKTVALKFTNWQDAEPVGVYSEIIEGIAEYEPGNFYKKGTALHSQPAKANRHWTN